MLAITADCDPSQLTESCVKVTLSLCLMKTLYPLIADPPLEVKLQSISTVELTIEVTGVEGVPGTYAAIIVISEEYKLNPNVVLAMILNVYDSPIVRPTTV